MLDPKLLILLVALATAINTGNYFGAVFFGFWIARHAYRLGQQDSEER